MISQRSPGYLKLNAKSIDLSVVNEDNKEQIIPSMGSCVFSSFC